MSLKNIVVFLTNGRKKTLGPFQTDQVKTDYQVQWEIDEDICPVDIKDYRVVDTPPPENEDG